MQINEIYRDIVVVLCLNYSKDIKGLKYIIVTLLTLFWIFYATPAILLRIPYVQQKVATTATRELSERLGVPVRIGNVDIEWFNRLVLENLYQELKEKVDFYFESPVQTVEKSDNGYIVHVKDESFYCDKCIISAGRSGSFYYKLIKEKSI